LREKSPSGPVHTKALPIWQLTGLSGQFLKMERVSSAELFEPVLRKDAFHLGKSPLCFFSKKNQNGIFKDFE